MNEGNQKIVVTGILQVGGKILIIRRSKVEAFLPGSYEFPGGKVHFGEQPVDALIREFKEETNLKITVHELISSFAYVSEDKKRHTVELFYRVSSAANPKVILAVDHDDFKLIDKNELESYILGFPKYITDIIKELK